VKTKVIPVITGKTETTSKSFRKILEQHTWESAISRNYKKKTAILGTTHVIWKVLTLKNKIFAIGNSITCSINSQYKMDVKL